MDIQLLKPETCKYNKLFCGSHKDCINCEYMNEVMKKWESFCDVPVDTKGCIVNNWNMFIKGTNRAKIIDWFYSELGMRIDILKKITGRRCNCVS